MADEHSIPPPGASAADNAIAATWGGRRTGAGRPKKSDAYRAKLEVRVHADLADACRRLGGSAFIRGAIERAAADALGLPHGFSLPDAKQKIEAVFDPASSAGANETSAEMLLGAKPLTSFLKMALDDAMAGAGIVKGDWMLFDRSVPPRHGDIVCAETKAGETVRRLYSLRGERRLFADGAGGASAPEAAEDFAVKAVLLGIIRPMR